MNEIRIVEYGQQRVLTTQQLAEAYNVETQTLVQNFNNNRKRYIQNKHYYLLEGEELRAFKRDIENFDVAANVNKLYLWTERGTLFHAKSLNTDKAWQIYDYLVESYFQKRQAPTIPQGKELLALAILEAQRTIEEKDRIIEEQKPKVLFADAVSISHTSILVGELAKLLKQNGIDIGQNRLFEWLRENGYLISRKGSDYNMPTQKSMELKVFEIKETVITHSDRSTSIKKTAKVTGKGQVYFINKFKVGKELAVR